MTQEAVIDLEDDKSIDIEDAEPEDAEIARTLKECVWLPQRRLMQVKCNIRTYLRFAVSPGLWVSLTADKIFSEARSKHSEDRPRYGSKQYVVGITTWALCVFDVKIMH